MHGLALRAAHRGWLTSFATITTIAAPFISGPFVFDQQMASKSSQLSYVLRVLLFYLRQLDTESCLVRPVMRLTRK